MIPVSQPFLPPIEDYNNLISGLWDSKWLTNNGTYVQKLEVALQEYLDVPTFHYVTNGTIALQIAIKALKIKGEVITTPFSFIATTTTILWGDCEPIFVDIDPKTLCIDANRIEEAITERTEAILATHVYGIPCDVEKIEQIAKKYNLKVIYDAAHAFGVRYKGKSLLDQGDISTLSFHATKLYHTVEGGGVVCNGKSNVHEKVELLRNFGIEGEKFLIPGINAKNSEFHAAMGLCNLKYINVIIGQRKKITNLYDEMLSTVIKRPVIPNGVEYNYAYYPIIFENEYQLLEVQKRLKNNSIQTRRYFYPSLNTLTYLNKAYNCTHSEDISSRVLCLPLYSELPLEKVREISKIVLEIV